MQEASARASRTPASNASAGDSTASVAAGADATYPFLGKSVMNRIMVTAAAFIPFALLWFGIAWAIGNGTHWAPFVALALFTMLSGLGITLGYHRLLAHGAFKASAPVRFILVWMGGLALQGGPASWAATHRRHHALADRPGDPHSPLEGLWHAHWGWLYKGNLVHAGPGHERLMRDPVVRFLERYQLAVYVSGFILPGLLTWSLGGTFWSGVLWGGAIRVFTVHHTTWSINSICHAWGTRPYESPDVARNNAIFGWLGFGEGWHNNHHAFPKSAYLGHRWYQFDLGKVVLLVLKPLGLVRDLHIPSREERGSKRVARRRRRQSAGAASL